MKVRKIQFKAARGTSLIGSNLVNTNTETTQSDEFVEYIDIGACERHYDELPLFNERKTSYKNWYINFKDLPMGVQMLTLNYYLLLYNAGDWVSDSLKINISKAIEPFNEFNQKWFGPTDAPFFHGLDLNWEGIEDQIAKTKENDEGVRTEIEFKDGSRIKFLDDDDSIESFFVLEKNLPELKLELANIIRQLK